LPSCLGFVADRQAEPFFWFLMVWILLVQHDQKGLNSSGKYVTVTVGSVSNLSIRFISFKVGR